MFFRLSSYKQKSMLMITSAHHSKELRLKKKKKRFYNPHTRNWHPVKVSQETIAEQKTGESEVECSLLDRLTQPRGRHLGTRFRSPLCSPLGTKLSVLCPQPAQSLCFPLPGASPSLTFDSFLPRIWMLDSDFTLEEHSATHKWHPLIPETPCLEFLTHWTFAEVSITIFLHLNF